MTVYSLGWDGESCRNRVAAYATAAIAAMLVVVAIFKIGASDG